MALIWGGTSMKPEITQVTEKYPAHKVGMQAGDLVKEINGHKIKTSDDISLYLAIARNLSSNVRLGAGSHVEITKTI